MLALIGLPVAAQEDEVRIVASFSILGDMVEEVVADLATVTTIVGPDTDVQVDQRIFSEKASGAQRERPELKSALDDVRAGDTLVVWIAKSGSRGGCRR